ncbi:unnamed protein product, partial [Prorocentrum cordatum]
ASLSRIPGEFSAKVVKGKLEGPGGDFVLRACGDLPTDCGKGSSTRLLIQSSLFAVLDRATPENGPLTPPGDSGWDLLRDDYGER